MFTNTITYTNNDSTWDSINDAVLAVRTIDTETRTAAEIESLSALVEAGDLILPASKVLSNDGTSYQFTSSATQAGVDALALFAEDSGKIDTDITKTMTGWIEE